MKRIRSLRYLLALVSLVASFAVLPALPVYADTPDSKAKADICGGLGVFGGDSGCGDGGAAVSHALAAAINILSLVVGIVAVIMIIIAGLRFITASGDSGKVATARTSIVYAVIGLVVVALAQTIVHFVLAKLG